MAWSTHELAELAGTTDNTVRYYHRVGRLDEPERRPNGYKQYGVRHLICLLRIRRLVELGVPVSRIGELQADGRLAPEVLLQVDVAMAADIERLQQNRSAIATILRDEASADAPMGFESVASRLSAQDSALLHVCGRMLDEDAMKDLRRMAETSADSVSREIEELPADADEPARRRLAEQLAPILTQHLVDYPWLTDPAAHLTRSRDTARQTLIDALTELYNPAQLDVLSRAGTLAALLYGSLVRRRRGQRHLVPAGVSPLIPTGDLTLSAGGRRRSSTSTSEPIETPEGAGQIMPNFDVQNFYSRYVEVINAHQWDRVGEFIDDTVLYHGETVTREQAIANFESLTDAILDLRWEVKDLVIGGDIIGTHAILRGTPVKEWLGVAPNGKPIELHEITVYKVRDGKFVQMSNVWDIDSLRNQLSN
ncbi:ester cyclase [Paractinoplanes lichenicola]|uniref:Ester cyclase n=1 Tax=Paractinoplanes lichenicola TaxID=2802976 RepID=A0ABS1VN40_9ACTN|nr:ester cyclase [Actinoplanes lichenicola]MBL7256018.1 ester cyclase [Actinoplanes lichenicola]